MSVRRKKFVLWAFGGVAVLVGAAQVLLSPVAMHQNGPGDATTLLLVGVMTIGLGLLMLEE